MLLMLEQLYFGSVSLEVFDYSSSHFGQVFTGILILTDQTEHLSAQEMLFQCMHGSK